MVAQRRGTGPQKPKEDRYRSGNKEMERFSTGRKAPPSEEGGYMADEAIRRRRLFG